MVVGYSILLYYRQAAGRGLGFGFRVQVTGLGSEFGEVRFNVVSGSIHRDSVL